MTATVTKSTEPMSDENLSKKRKSKALKVTGALAATTLMAGLTASTVATWTDSSEVNQTLSSGGEIFEVEISTNGGETWSSETLGEDEGNGEVIVDFASLQFDGNTDIVDGEPVFAPGQSQTAEVLVRVSDKSTDSAVVWVSDAGGEGAVDNFSWSTYQAGGEEAIAWGDSLGEITEDEGGAVVEAGEEATLEINVEYDEEIDTSSSEDSNPASGYWVLTAQEQFSYEYQGRDSTSVSEITTESTTEPTVD